MKTAEKFKIGDATLNHQHVVAPRIHILLLPISKDKNNRINCRGTRFLQNSFLFVVKFQKSVTYIPHLKLAKSGTVSKTFKIVITRNSD
jgi:hypothetical protein